MKKDKNKECRALMKLPQERAKRRQSNPIPEPHLFICSLGGFDPEASTRVPVDPTRCEPIIKIQKIGSCLASESSWAER